VGRQTQGPSTDHAGRLAARARGRGTAWRPQMGQGRRSGARPFSARDERRLPAFNRTEATGTRTGLICSRPLDILRIFDEGSDGTGHGGPVG
jgi:hypothetical protein